MAPRSHRRRLHGRRSWALASCATSMLVLASACGGNDTTGSAALDTAAATSSAVADEPSADESPTTPSTSPTSPTSPTVADTAQPPDDTPADAPAPIELLSFQASLVGGGTFDGASYGAERPVALWFWAPT